MSRNGFTLQGSRLEWRKWACSGAARLYVLADARVAGHGLVQCVAEALAGGARMIQVRAKVMRDRELLAAARACVELCHERDAWCLINDRPDIAVLAGADGVHLGQEDLPPTEARSFLGQDAIIGYSTHSPEQFREALAGEPVDYLACGPVYESVTKRGAHARIGLDQVRRCVSSSRGCVPVCAIGGIDMDNARAVAQTGVRLLASISTVMKAPVRHHVEEMISLLT